MYIHIHTHTQARSVNVGKCAGSAGTESRSSPGSVTRAGWSRSFARSYILNIMHRSVFCRLVVSLF